MATLYVENVPDDVYEALRQRARENRSSIAAEVLSLLRSNVPTAEELTRRQMLLKRALRMQSQKPGGPGPFASAEELQREDRLR
jgi:plasmid stability protein